MSLKSALIQYKGEIRATITWIALMLTVPVAIFSLMFGVLAILGSDVMAFDDVILLRDGCAASAALLLTYASFASAKGRTRAWFITELLAVVIGLAAIGAHFGGWGDATPGTFVVMAGLVCTVVLTIRSFVVAGPQDTYFPFGN